MNNEWIMQEYYRVLTLHQYDSIIKLFSPTAVIDHPIFGEVKASKFFKILLDRAKSHEITILNLFHASDQPNRSATYLRAKFITGHDKSFDETGVHIFDFSTKGLIDRMTVVIDTYPFRSDYA